MFEVGVIVVSDRAARGERKDACLPVFQEHLDGSQYRIAGAVVVSDEPGDVQTALREMIGRKYALIFTAGGTGCGPRDNTPEVTSSLLQKRTPGIDEAIRSCSMAKNRNAAYSRGVSGIAGETLVINLPGSPRAVREILDFLMPGLEHPLRLIAGETVDCAPAEKDHD